jgi:hypothetical protein
MEKELMVNDKDSMVDDENIEKQRRFNKLMSENEINLE